MTGGGGGSNVFWSNVFFWVENLHAWYFFGSRDLSRIFLGLKKIQLFFWVLYLRANFSSRVFVAISGSEKYSFKLYFSDVCSGKTVNIVARYFFGSKISGLCIFLDLQYEAPSDPPDMYTLSTPPGLVMFQSLRKSNHLAIAFVLSWQLKDGQDLMLHGKEK